MTLINDKFSSPEVSINDSAVEESQMSQSQIDALPGNATNLRHDAMHAPHGPANDGHHHGVTSREAWDAARAEMMTKGLDWPATIWLGVIHISCLVAPFFFSWEGLIACLFLHWVTGGIGVCLGYHRLLTHTSFKCPNWVRYTLAVIGGLSGEGSALHWTANHRKHHAHSDHEGDPHSPLDGPWWSHILWTAVARTDEDLKEFHDRWIPDLKDDKGLILIHKLFLPSHFALGALLAGIGYWLGGRELAWSMVIWGMFVRLAFVLHSTWFVNSASHMWGYRNYDTTDESRNNWWVALLTYGEGWHNNHHAYPRMARHGHKWWEIDVTFITISLMEKLGWATEVVDHQHKQKDDLNTIRKPAAAIDTAAILKANYAELEKRRASQPQGRETTEV